MASSNSATSAEADLMSIGQHCSVPDCGLRDFLPFKCDCCNATFCLEHRSYGAHSCPKADKKASSTIVCPLCAKAIKLFSEEDANAAFDRHTNEGCDPANYARVHAKPKCPVSGCRERLTTINTYHCKHCRESVCLKHRFPQDHACAKRPGADKAAPASAVDAVRDFFGIARAAATSQAPPRSTVSATGAKAADARRPQRPVSSQASGMPQSTRSMAQTGPDQGTSGAASQREMCPLCSASFSNLDDLIAHSQFHERSQACEICPHCRAAFSSAVALIDHVERSHASYSACVVC